MRKLFPLLLLALCPTVLQAQDPRPKLDPAQREALRSRAAEIREKAQALRSELRDLRGGSKQEPGAKPPREGRKHGGLRDLRRQRGQRGSGGAQIERPSRGSREAGPVEKRMLLHRWLQQRRSGERPEGGREMPPQRPPMRRR